MRGKWVTWYFYCLVNTALILLTSLPASLLVWLSIPVAEDPSQNNPSCHTLTPTQSLLLIATVFSRDAAVVVSVSILQFCNQSCTSNPLCLCRILLRGQGLPAGPACIVLQPWSLALQTGIQIVKKTPGFLGTRSLNKLSSATDKGQNPYVLKKTNKKVVLSKCTGNIWQLIWITFIPLHSAQEKIYIL